MKRIIICICIITFIIASCVFGLINVKSTVDEMSDILLNASSFCDEGNYDQCFEMTREFENKWKSKEKMFTLLLDSDKFEIIGFSSTTLISLIEKKKYNEYCIEAKKIIKYLEHIWDTEKPSILNIL